jgi:hypothetical protein
VQHGHRHRALPSAIKELDVDFSLAPKMRQDKQFARTKRALATVPFCHTKLDES